MCSQYDYDLRDYGLELMKPFSARAVFAVFRSFIPLVSSIDVIEKRHACNENTLRLKIEKLFLVLMRKVC